VALCEVLDEQAGLLWSRYPLNKLSRLELGKVVVTSNLVRGQRCVRLGLAAPAWVPDLALICSTIRHRAHPPGASVSARALSPAHQGFAACSRRALKGCAVPEQPGSAPACRRHGRAPSSSAGGFFRWPAAAQGAARLPRAKPGCASSQRSEGAWLCFTACFLARLWAERSLRR